MSVDHMRDEVYGGAIAKPEFHMTSSVDKESAIVVTTNDTEQQLERLGLGKNVRYSLCCYR